jgi:dipeptide/tripeptide permease
MCIDFFVNEPAQLMVKALAMVYVVPFMGDWIADLGIGELVGVM